MYQNEKSPLSAKTAAFAKRIIKMVKYMHREKDKSLATIYTQILRSGTSISANIGESQYAQSPADFITKLHISLKEANETRRWLNMLLDGDCLTEKQFESLDKDLGEIIAMLVSSLNTCKRNMSVVVK